MTAPVPDMIADSQRWMGDRGAAHRGLAVYAYQPRYRY